MQDSGKVVELFLIKATVEGDKKCTLFINSLHAAYSTGSTSGTSNELSTFTNIIEQIIDKCNTSVANVQELASLVSTRAIFSHSQTRVAQRCSQGLYCYLL